MPHSTSLSLRKTNLGIASPPLVRKRAKTSGAAPLKIHLKEKLRVVPFGVGDEFAPLETGAAREEARKELGLDKPYVLFVGRVEPK